MNTFRLSRVGVVGAPVYLVRAETATKARQLVARVVPEASAATNIELYYCLPDPTQTLPDYIIQDTGGHRWSVA